MAVDSFLSSVLIILSIVNAKDVPCEWKSLGGAHFNLKPLILSSNEKSYYIKDGDIPCTTNIEEPAYSYTWNLCSPVSDVSVPDACKKLGKSSAVALQYMQNPGFDLTDCYVIGKYDAANDDLSYKLLDDKDPTKGLSITYAAGDRCNVVGNMRTTTIDVVCDNVDTRIVSALEPSTCEYHLVMKSYHGCPTECPITSEGLCNSHGHCSFDPIHRKPYCYCNEGYCGSSCTKCSGDDSYNGFGVQLGLLITLLIITLALVGVVGFMIYRVLDLRKQNVNDYKSLSGGESEMVTHVF